MTFLPASCGRKLERQALTTPASLHVGTHTCLRFSKRHSVAFQKRPELGSRLELTHRVDWTDRCRLRIICRCERRCCRSLSPLPYFEPGLELEGGIADAALFHC